MNFDDLPDAFDDEHDFSGIPPMPHSRPIYMTRQPAITADAVLDLMASVVNDLWRVIEEMIRRVGVALIHLTYPARYGMSVEMVPSSDPLEFGLGIFN